MASDPRDMFGTRNNTNDSKKRFKSNTESTFDMFNINVSKANKAVDSIFDYAKKSTTDFNKYYVQTTSQTMKTVADITISTYTKVYTQLESMHKSYLSGIVDREMSAASEVAKKWAEVRNNSSSNNNVIYGSRGQILSSSSNTTNSSNNIKISAPDMSNFMKSLNTSLGNKVGNYNSHISKSISSLRESLPDEVGEATEQGAKNGSSILSKALNMTLGKYLDIWIARFTQGINKIYNMYESTYTGVSVVMNQNQKQYMSWQSQAMGSINQMGLNNNIAISKVMETLSEVTKQGISGQKAQNKALADTISRTIAPFVDTTTSAYTDLQFKLGDQLVNTMNGLGENISQQTGQQRVFSSGINQIITMLDPIMLNAKADYADKYLGEAMAGLEQAVSSGAMTQEQALQMAYDASQGATDWYSAVTSDNLLLRTAAIDAEDPTNVAEILKGMVGAGNNIYQGVNGVREQSTVSNVIGAKGYVSQNADWYTISESIDKGMSEYNHNAEMTGKMMLNNLANDKYTTATAMKDIAAENASLGAAQFKQKYPDAYTILEGILATLISGNFIFGGIGDEIVNKLFKKTRVKKVRGSGSTSNPGLFSKMFGLKGTGASAVGPKGLFGTGGTLATKGAGTWAGKGGLLTGGASAGAGSVAASLVGGAAGAAVATGGIMATKDAMKSIGNHRSNTSTGQKVADYAQATAGIGATAVGAVGGASLLLLGSNPVGWAILGAGTALLGVSAAAKVISKQFDKTSAATKAVTAAYDKQKGIMKEEAEVRKQQQKELSKTFEQTEGLEDKRQLLISEGIISEEDAKGKTEAFFDETYEEYEKQLKDYNKWKKESDKRSLKQSQKEQKEITQKNAEDNQKKILETINNTSGNEQKEILKSLGVKDKDIESIQSGKRSVEDVLTSKRNSWANGAGLWGDNSSYLEALDDEDFKALSESNKFKNLTTAKMTAEEYASAKAEYDSAKNMMKKYGTGKDLKGQIKKDYEAAKELLDTKYKDGLPSMYAAGNSYVASDQMAYIHQGEAVLTKEQNKQYRNVASSIPIFGKFLGGLFNNKSGMQETEEEDAKRSDIITTMNDGFNKLVDAIMSIKTNENMNKQARTSVGIAEPVVSSYAENIVKLTPSMATANK